MSVSHGIYSIRSAAFNESYVGRNRIEDFSLLPKGVYSQPLSKSINNNIVWDVVESEVAGFFKLKIEGAPTAIIDNRVFAILLEYPASENWHIKPLSEPYEGQYMVHTQNGSLAWYLPDGVPFTQVEVGPLPVQTSEPPQYPLNQRWMLDRLD